MFAQVNDSKTNKLDEKVILAEELIENGSTNIAYILLEDYLKAKNIPKETKYRVYRDLAKIHMYENDIVNYEKFNRKAYELKKKDGEIYKGMYFSEKAYFFHFLTWGDSALYYSNRAMEIIQRNRKDYSKISVPFVYQIYAITFLYRKIDPAIKYKIEHQMPIARIVMNQWFDSAKVYEKKFPFQFSSDRVLLYRGVGTRYLDHVSGYNYVFKDAQKKMGISQWYSYQMALNAFNYTLENVINKNNWNDRISTTALKGLNYMCIGEKVKAKQLFNKTIKNYQATFGNFENCPNSKSLMTLYSYKTTNEETLPYDEQQTQKDIAILKKLYKSWWALFAQSKEYNYDTYSSSPNHYLFKLYLRRFFVKKQKKDLKNATEHLLTQILHFHYLKDENYSNNHRFNNANIELSKIKDLRLKNLINKSIHFNHYYLKSAPKIELELIQKKLKTNECIVVPCTRKSSNDSYKIVIQPNKIEIVKSKNDLNYNTIDFDTLSFHQYKKYAYQEYQDKVEPILKVNKKINKIYTLYFDYTNYNGLIKNTLGSNYDKLNYVAKSIQFTSIYDPYDFFIQPKKQLKNELTFLKLKTENYSKLPFMDHLSHEKFTPIKSESKIFNGNLTQFLNKKGILHLYGHGDLKINLELGSVNFQLPCEIKEKDTCISSINYINQVENSLIVLNNCYSGFNSNISSREFDRGMYLYLLNKGAKNIIVSPLKTDDECSAKIFYAFYNNIAKGQTTEDALYHAQLSYLKNNKGSLCHPKFWTPYRLISNYRYPLLENNQGDKQKLKYLIGVLLSFILLILIHLNFQMKHF